MKKLLTTSVLSILLVSLAGGVYGQSTKEHLFRDGRVWIGEMRENRSDCPEGMGTMKYPNGAVYIGQHNCSSRDGQGTMTYSNGNIYSGRWMGDDRTGNGIFTRLNGDVFHGQYAENERHGSGTETFADGNVYVGRWLEGRVTGPGTYTSANGDVYVAEINGQGTFTYTDGNVYVGEYKRNTDYSLIRHGQGTITFSDGSTKVGVWDNDSYLGTKAEVDKIEREREALEEEIKNKYDRINSACLLDKSKNVDMQVASIRRAVEFTCEAIAEDPSWWDEFKYN